MQNHSRNNALHKAAVDHHFSGVISIIERGNQIFEAAYGLADRSNNILNRCDTRFGTASGTKFFTALGIGKLIDSGEISLESRLDDLVPYEFPHFDPAITVKHLLTHTSGVYDYYDEEIVEDFDNFFVDIPWYQLRTPRDYLPLFQNEPMKFSPGERYAYSNGGYILLGIIIEEVTNRVYRDFIEEHVCKACGMVNSGFFALNQLPGRTALGYMVDEQGNWRTNHYHLPVIGASDGGAFTTAADIARLWQAFVNNELLSPSLTAMYQEPQVDIYENEVSYGIGLYIWKKYTPPTLYIQGSDAGVGFDSRYFPKLDLTITILANETDGEAAMLKIIYDNLGEIIPL